MADHKKLIVWVAAKDLAVEVYRLVGVSALARDYGLRDQLLRAAVSVPSNIAEGYARKTSADRKHFLTIALGSCAELETQLLITSEVGLVASASAQALIAKVTRSPRCSFLSGGSFDESLLQAVSSKPPALSYNLSAN